MEKCQMTRPADRAVLVTGCSSGIGRCVAHGLQQRAYRVFATARDAKDVASLRRDGLESLRLDLTDSASIEDAVGEILERTDGRLYGLFNNAGYGQPGAVEDLPRQALREQFEVNVFGTHELTRRLIPVMLARGEGRIIQNSSVLGVVAMPFRGAYNASKFALEGLSDTLRLELKGSGVHVVIIEPGPVLSRFRVNALAAFRRHVDAGASRHAGTYAHLEDRLARTGAVVPFTLPPEAVLAKVIRALEARRPRPRYPVTVPAIAFAWLRRLLPVRWLDALLSREMAAARRSGRV
jgi:NAD(P)-dependent dehydrogenase (short-subunit alcohol dehydrogenase family)